MESLSDIETSNFKALLTYHFLIDAATYTRGQQTNCEGE